MNSHNIKAIDKSKPVNISIKINAADNMNVYVYQGNDRSILK